MGNSEEVLMGSSVNSKGVLLGNSASKKQRRITAGELCEPGGVQTECPWGLQDMLGVVSSQLNSSSAVPGSKGMRA